MTPPHEKLTQKDRLMYNLPLGKKEATPHINLALTFCMNVDNVFGFVLSSIFSFVGGSIAFGSEYPASEHLTSYLDVIAAAKPTVFAR